MKAITIGFDITIICVCGIYLAIGNVSSPIALWFGFLIGFLADDLVEEIFRARPFRDKYYWCDVCHNIYVEEGGVLKRVIFLGEGIKVQVTIRSCEDKIISKVKWI
jgi:hypothetical protein